MPGTKDTIRQVFAVAIVLATFTHDAAAAAPGFFGYMTSSCDILLPLCVLVTLICFR